MLIYQRVFLMRQVLMFFCWFPGWEKDFKQKGGEKAASIIPQRD
jgi:hypothetical protein